MMRASSVAERTRVALRIVTDGSGACNGACAGATAGGLDIGNAGGVEEQLAVEPFRRHTDAFELNIGRQVEILGQRARLQVEVYKAR